MEHKKIVTELNLNRPHQGPGLFSLYLFTNPPTAEKKDVDRKLPMNEWEIVIVNVLVLVSVSVSLCVYLLNIYLIF